MADLQLGPPHDPGIDAFCAGVGTAGMLMGVSRAFRSHKGAQTRPGAEAQDRDRKTRCSSQRTRIVALEPASSPVLTTGNGGPHRVEGIAAGFRPPHLQDGQFDEVRTIDEQEARTMACRLAKEEDIFASTSSGLNIVAAVQLARELGPGKTVATVAVDSGLKYLAGDLYSA